MIESGSETLHKICQLHCGSPLFCRNQVCLFLTSVCFLCILAVWGRCLSYWEIWHSSKSESLYKSHTYNVIVALLCWTSCTQQDFCSKTLIFWASSPAKPPTLYVCNGKEITVRIWGAIQHSSGLEAAISDCRVQPSYQWQRKIAGFRGAEAQSVQCLPCMPGLSVQSTEFFSCIFSPIRKPSCSISAHFFIHFNSSLSESIVNTADCYMHTNCWYR